MSDLESLPIFQDAQSDDRQAPTRIVVSRHPAGAGFPVTPLLATRRADPTEAAADVDWALVRELRGEAAEQLSRESDGMDDAERRELGREIIAALLRGHNDGQIDLGRPALTPALERRVAAAVHDALFGLGRLQRLVDDPELADIEIRGYDNVHLIYADGRLERGEPVADSNEDLIETIAFLAAREGRSFSSVHSKLDLPLPGRARLAASAWTNPWPMVTIRLKPLGAATMPQLVELGTVSPALSGFLGAAVRARKSVLVAGGQGYGKTTLLQALASELDPDEAIGTVESEYELYLHEMPDRHRRVYAEQSRPGSGERGPDGRAAGEVTLEDAIYGCLRHNLSRIVVGELRGAREFRALMQAITVASGSLSTVHAYSPRAAIERLAAGGVDAGYDTAHSYRQIAEHIALVIQIDKRTVDGRPERFVSEVVEVTTGDDGRPGMNRCFVPGHDGRAIPMTAPSFLTELKAFGFDPHSAFPAQAAEVAGTERDIWVARREGGWS